MKKFKVYGSGCSKCKDLQSIAETVAQELGIPFETEKITDINVIIENGIMNTPALAIDGEIVFEGKVPDTSKMKEALSR